MNRNTFVSVIINNYNYDNFLQGAIESVLAQSYQFFEIIIIDDGSTDNSIELLHKLYSSHNKITIISKKNEGQLSCFNVGIEAAKGDILFFLDSDDTYKPTYLEEITDLYQKHPHFDFIFCSLEEFGNSHNIQNYQNIKENIDFGITFLQTLFLKPWIGMQTSAISVKKEILEKFFPIPYLSDWRTRADDCLVWGASLAEARKYYFAKPLVNYRIHGDNAYVGKKFDNTYLYKRELSILRLFYFYEKRLKYSTILLNRNTDILKLMSKEFKTISHATKQDIKQYIKIATKLKINFLKKMKLQIKLHRILNSKLL